MRVHLGNMIPTDFRHMLLNAPHARLLVTEYHEQMVALLLDLRRAKAGHRHFFDKNLPKQDRSKNFEELPVPWQIIVLRGRLQAYKDWEANHKQHVDRNHLTFLKSQLRMLYLRLSPQRPLHVANLHQSVTRCLDSLGAAGLIGRRGA